MFTKLNRAYAYGSAHAHAKCQLSKITEFKKASTKSTTIIVTKVNKQDFNIFMLQSYYFFTAPKINPTEFSKSARRE